jgi:hypothetical protein
MVPGGFLDGLTAVADALKVQRDCPRFIRGDLGSHAREMIANDPKDRLHILPNESR